MTGIRLADRNRGSVVNWTSQAACRDEDPELFFPIGDSGPALWQIEEAKQVCRRCDVVEACLAWALAMGEHNGVWGGLSELERRTLRHRSSAEHARTR